MCLTCGCDRELSKNERIKAASDQLRGTIAEELTQDTPTFTEDSAQLLKFHGIYQQEDRDKRKEARKLGLDRHYQMMVRTRIPGGRVSPAGYIAHDDIADRWGNGTLRITTRQDFQLHGVLKGDLWSSIHGINEALMTTLGGCGDQVRNVMGCPAPLQDRLRSELQEILPSVVRGLTPTTSAYHEIWVDSEQVHTSREPDQPDALYGANYLPRKFKVGLAVEGDNCVDIYSHDLGLVALRDPDGGLAGFDVLVGGGLGRTYNKPDTYPAVARLMAFVEPDQVVATSRAGVAVQRDYGNRTDRRHARLKYLLAERGLDWFREQVQSRVDFPLQDPRPLEWEPLDDHLGWHEQGDGRLFYGLFVENGRIQDEGDFRLKTVLRRIVEDYGLVLWMTAQQNVILADLDPAFRTDIEALLTSHGVTLSERTSRAVRHAMACPAIPTCGLAVAESERVLPDLIRQIERVVADLGLAEERISYRMTGCPNGCARPYLGDVGFVGTTLGKYDVFLGGDFLGTRLNALYAHNVPMADIPALLAAPLGAFASERQQEEGFGDWCHRVGVERLKERFAA